MEKRFILSVVHLEYWDSDETLSNPFFPFSITIQYCLLFIITDFKLFGWIRPSRFTLPVTPEYLKDCLSTLHQLHSKIVCSGESQYWQYRHSALVPFCITLVNVLKNRSPPVPLTDLRSYARNKFVHATTDMITTYSSCHSSRVSLCFLVVQAALQAFSLLSKQMYRNRPDYHLQRRRRDCRDPAQDSSLKLVEFPTIARQLYRIAPNWRSIQQK